MLGCSPLVPVAQLDVANPERICYDHRQLSHVEAPAVLGGECSRLREAQVESDDGYSARHLGGPG